MLNVSCRSKTPIKERFALLKEIEDRVKKCQDCSLGGQRKSPLAGRFVEPTDVLVIDRMPSESEDKLGIILPEVRTKNLLKLFALAKPVLDLSKTSYTTLFKCFGSDTTSKACLTYIDSQIEILDPILIITWGEEVSRFVTGRDDIELGIPYITGKADQHLLFPMMHPRTLIADRDKNVSIWRSHLDVLSKISVKYDFNIFSA